MAHSAIQCYVFAICKVVVQVMQTSASCGITATIMGPLSINTIILKTHLKSLVIFSQSLPSEFFLHLKVILFLRVTIFVLDE